MAADQMRERQSAALPAEQPQHHEAASTRHVERSHESERLPEQIGVEIKKEERFLEETIDSLKRRLRGAKKQQKKDIPQVRDQMTVQIERVLEQGLAEAYKELTPVQKQEFKIKGEQTAIQIRAMMKRAHVSVKKIFRLIFQWLSMLPGISRFFLEQEAKIKTDKILAMKDQYRHDS